MPAGVVLVHPRLPVDARAVVCDPARYAGRVVLRRLAWAALMGARGRRVHQGRLAAMAVDTGVASGAAAGGGGAGDGG